MKFAWCFFLVFADVALGCSNLIVTPGASQTGSTIYSYAADSAGLYGTLDRYVAKKNIPKGTMRKTYDWDSGVYLGEIPEAEETYDVIGNMNEYQLTIGETTFGGVEVCMGQTTALIDYGTLIILGLQRAKTAREAITVMTDLVAKYGYYSEGESFTLTDPKEAWIMEMIGKGPGETGAVWVARQVPDGHITAHANQSRIRFLEDGDLYAKDVIDFAISKGLYSTSSGAAFSFADAYDPINFIGCRAAEARVWSYFSVWAEDRDFEAKYADYASGKDQSNRMPWSVPVRGKLVVQDLMTAMRNDFTGTILDMTKDVGAGSWLAKYRDRPLTWTGPDNAQYVNERAIGTQQTGWHFVSEMRSWLPDHLGVCFWFAPDDTRFSTHIPFYPYADIPKALMSTTGAITDFTFDSLFWRNNLVSNRVYPQWEILAPVVTESITKLEDEFLRHQAVMEKLAATKSKEDASKMLSEMSAKKVDMVMGSQMKLWKYLTVTWRDGVKIDPPSPGHDHGGDIMGGGVGNVIQGSGIGDNQWPESWRFRIANETGDHFKVVDNKEKLSLYSSEGQWDDNVARKLRAVEGDRSYSSKFLSKNPIGQPQVEGEGNIIIS